MKKILFVVESLSVGGAENILCNIVRNLDRSRYEPTVFTVVRTGVHIKDIGADTHLKYMLRDSGELSLAEKVKYRKEYKRIYSSEASKIYKEYIKEEYDVEIAFIEGFATKLVAASPNNKSLKFCWVHVDMIKNTNADKCFKSIEDERMAYLVFDRIMAVSGSVRDAFRQKFNISENVHIQYNPVDSNDIISKADEEVEIEGSGFKGIKLVMVGRLEEQKGYDRLMLALTDIKTEIDNIRIWILGSGSQEKRLKEYVINNDLKEHVLFCGYLSNPYPYIKMADALLCTSRTEGFSTVATEALILGKPIFTTECSGMRELFGENHCGVIFENTQIGIEQNIAELNSISGETLEEYSREAIKRSNCFLIAKRMKEIEDLLDERKTV